MLPPIQRQGAEEAVKQAAERQLSLVEELQRLFGQEVKQDDESRKRRREEEKKQKEDDRQPSEGATKYLTRGPPKPGNCSCNARSRGGG